MTLRIAALKQAGPRLRLWAPHARGAAVVVRARP
jgi:hypothetical protein